MNEAQKANSSPLSGAQREAVARRCATKHYQGWSIRRIARFYNFSASLVRTLLIDAGVVDYTRCIGENAVLIGDELERRFKCGHSIEAISLTTGIPQIEIASMITARGIEPVEAQSYKPTTREPASARPYVPSRAGAAVLRVFPANNFALLSVSTIVRSCGRDQQAVALAISEMESAGIL